MPSRPEARVSGLGFSLVCLLALAFAGPGGPAAAQTPPEASQVRAAVERVRSDPNLPGTRTEKSLRWKDRSEQPEAKPPDSPPLAWLGDLLRAIAEGARGLVWGLGAVLVAWLVVGIRRWVKRRAPGGTARTLPLPSHIGDLDIRPDSLPADIGAAAQALWQQGQARAALSLLYRGALSRLVHDHGVPIRSASTEGECTRLSARHLPAARQAFFGQLVQAWQLAAYGTRLPSTPQVLALCTAFEPQLGQGGSRAESVAA